MNTKKIKSILQRTSDQYQLLAQPLKPINLLTKMEKLPKEFKEKWVAALRSGKYKQGAGKLFSDASNTYCCLGVACIVAGVPRRDIQSLPTIPLGEKWGNVPSLLKGTKTAADLAVLNDGMRGLDREEIIEPPRSFDEIANYIEDNL